jgi:DNA-3-methyladenine glycosylase
MSKRTAPPGLIETGLEPLTPNFFERPALKVARELIGCQLHSTVTGQRQSHIITETEAYVGEHDLASHASKGRTKRNEVMFGPPGILYVYFVYGLHWMLNVVTGSVGDPSAVLIRAVDGIVGPARLTKALGITGELTGKRATTRTGVWFSEGRSMPQRLIQRTPRIGIDYAGPVWSAKPYRFLLREG